MGESRLSNLDRKCGVKLHKILKVLCSLQLTLSSTFTFKCSSIVWSVKAFYTTEVLSLSVW